MWHCEKFMAEWKGGLQKKAKKEGKKSAPENRNTKRKPVSEDGNAYSNGWRTQKKKEENARQMVQNDLMTIKEKIRQIDLVVAVLLAVTLARQWEKDQAELLRGHLQVWEIVLTIGWYQER